MKNGVYFNLNNNIRFWLTREGHLLIEDEKPYWITGPNDDGSYEAQAWQLFARWGDKLDFGKELPFWLSIMLDSEHLQPPEHFFDR